MHFPLTDGTTQTLHVDLGKALGAAHHIRWVNSLVSRNHYHLLRTVFNGHVRNLAGAGDIHQNRLTGVFLHQRNMLVGGGVEDHLGMVIFEYHTHALFNTDVTDDRNEIYIGIILLEFKTHIMQRGLSRIKHDKFTDAQTDKLAAKFAAYAACCTGHQNDFTTEFRSHLAKVDIDFRTAQKVLDLDGTDPLVEVTVRIGLTDRRGYQGLEIIALAVFQKTVFLKTGILITGKQNTFNATLTDDVIHIGIVFKIINGKIGQTAAAVVPDIKACHLVMGTVPETKLQRHTLLVGAIDKDTGVLLVHPVQQ